LKKYYSIKHVLEGKLDEVKKYLPKYQDDIERGIVLASYTNKLAVINFLLNQNITFKNTDAIEIALTYDFNELKSVLMKENYMRCEDKIFEIAVAFKDMEIINYLLNSGNYTGIIPFKIACLGGMVELAENIYKKDMLMDENKILTERYDIKVFYTNICAKDLLDVFKMLEKYINYNISDIIYSACKYAAVNILEYVLSKNIHTDVDLDQGYTQNIINGIPSPKILKLLIEKGNKSYIEDKRMDTALMVSIINAGLDIKHVSPQYLYYSEVTSTMGLHGIQDANTFKN
jgi:hypothetical protein